MKVIIADENTLYREGFSLLMSSIDSKLQLTKASCWNSLLESIEDAPFDLIFLSKNLPGTLSWRYEVRKIVFSNRVRHIVLKLNHTDLSYAHLDHQLGFSYLITKDTSVAELKMIIFEVGEGNKYLINTIEKKYNRTEVDPFLTQRQLEILFLLKDGGSNKTISNFLNLSEGTVKQHLHVVYKKLLVSNRVEALRVATKLGLI